MIEVRPVMSGPDYSDTIEVELDRDDIGGWSGGTAEGVLFTIDVHSAGKLFARLGETIKIIEANADPQLDPDTTD